MSSPSSYGEHGYVDSSGVKIHYVASAAMGDCPLVVLVHGCPDHWYGWHRQIPALAQHFQVVAIDLRGYNLSDQPEGVDAYRFENLVGDVDAVRRHFQRDAVTLVGHDWGGFISWRYAMAHPDRIERLVVLNIPHPRCLERELATNPLQHRASEYARQFQQLPKGERTLMHEGVPFVLTPEALAAGQKDEAVRAIYVEALRRSSLDGILSYYKANYPHPPYRENEYPPVRCPVLVIHGLDDIFLMPGGLNDTWRYVENDFTLVTVPGAGHWVHHDAADLVNTRIIRWLKHEW